VQLEVAMSISKEKPMIHAKIERRSLQGLELVNRT
jgi:hypothetical protein